MRRNPTNIALSSDVQRRLRVVAAGLGKRPCELAEAAILDKLPEMELQAAELAGRRKPATQGATQHDK